MENEVKNKENQLNAVFIGQKSFLIIGLVMVVLALLFLVLPVVFMGDPYIMLGCIPCLVLSGFFTYYGIIIRCQKLTVSSQGINGIAAFPARGMRRMGMIDLPMDSITSIMLVKNIIGGGVSFSTSSGNIRFIFVKNFKEVYDFVKQKLDERQKTNKGYSRNSDEEMSERPKAVSKFDELNKLHDLKKNGVITEEEFQREKEKLLK